MAKYDEKEAARLRKEIDDLRSEREAVQKAERTPASKARALEPGEEAKFAAPAVIKGEMPSSRPFRMLNVAGYMLGHVPAERAKVELEILGGIRKAMEESGSLMADMGISSAIVPFSTRFLPDDLVNSDTFRKAVAPMAAGLAHDPDEVRWLRNRTGTVYKTESPLSYLDDTVGGTLVPPPDQGEVLELMRPVPGLQRAGAKMVPLPPQGKRVYPRVTSPSTAYWITENTSITESQIGTGQVALMAKKLAFVVRVPNELFRYASAAADAIVRQDGTRSLELGLDYAGFYGAGSGGQPKGLKLFTGSNEVQTQTATVTGTDGDTLQPQDGYQMVGKVEDRNFNFEGWIMRSAAWAKVSSVRAAAVTTTDTLGPFVQDLTRGVGFAPNESYCGYKVTKSNVISNAVTKGSGTNLSEVWGGQWSALYLGMYGAVELTTSNQAGTAFLQDQSLIRGILHADIVPAYPGAFIYATPLVIY